MYERGSEVDALRYAFEQYQWLARPSASQEERIAEVISRAVLPIGRLGMLWGGALAFREWIEAGEARAPFRGKAALAIDIIAAHPVISATTLAAKLSVSVQAACVLLERFVERGLIVDVTQRSTRRLFALKDFAPLRESVRKPRKPLSCRKRGRPRTSEIMDLQGDDVMEDVVFQPLPRWQPDFSDLEAAMKAVDTLTCSLSSTS